ncbi:MAG: type II toxin-antitoxin system VapC family toxin [Candidatus Aminicenantes bacterium]|nr:type II toxin-antitoxin system VapC family toxin [Candidatus Aminicenantes bacterium]
MVLLDTCALIWWTLDPKELSKPAARACDEIQKTGGVISSISVWEIGIKIKRGKINIGISLEEYVSRLKRLSRFEIAAVDEDIWISSINLDWSHKDPADRAIVATAALRNIPIVSKDTIIRDFYSNVIW